MTYRLMLMASAQPLMSTQVDGTGKVTTAGDATTFGNEGDPVVKAAPTQAGTSAAEVTDDRPAHWPQDKGEDGKYLVNSEGEMGSWYAEQMKAAQEGKAPAEATQEVKTAEEKAPEAKAPEAKTEEKAPEAKPEPLTDEQIAANLKEAGGIYADEKYLPFAIEVERTGALSPESLTKAAEAFGVPPEYVKTFVDGQLATKELATSRATQAATAAQTAAQQKIAEAVLSVVPDPAAYDTMMKWGASAESTIPAETKEAYDSALARGDAVTVKALVNVIKAAHEAATGGETRRDITQNRATEARAAATPAAKPFGSSREMTDAMGSRRYATDASYRAEVNARVGVSSFSD